MINTLNNFTMVQSNNNNNKKYNSKSCTYQDSKMFRPPAPSQITYYLCQCPPKDRK